MEGYFLRFFLGGGAFFFVWLLASGFWLLAASGSFGFGLLACICCILEPKSLICVLFAAVWSQFACPFGFWLLASGLYLLHFGAHVSDLRAICCSLEPICMPIWLLAFGSFGFWLLACICYILEPKSLICLLFAAVWSQFACPFGFWLLAPSVSGF